MLCFSITYQQIADVFKSLKTKRNTIVTRSMLIDSLLNVYELPDTKRNDVDVAVKKFLRKQVQLQKKTSSSRGAVSEKECQEVYINVEIEEDMDEDEDEHFYKVSILDLSR